MLREAGYHVEAAADGAAALDLALEPGAEFDLVVSDVVMPRMSGLDLAEHLAAAKPRTKVLLISGHMSHPSLRDREVPSGVALLAKPFEPVELTAKVRELLGLLHWRRSGVLRFPSIRARGGRVGLPSSPWRFGGARRLHARLALSSSVECVPLPSRLLPRAYVPPVVARGAVRGVAPLCRKQGCPRRTGLPAPPTLPPRIGALLETCARPSGPKLPRPIYSPLTDVRIPPRVLARLPPRAGTSGLGAGGGVPAAGIKRRRRPLRGPLPTPSRRAIRGGHPAPATRESGTVAA